MKTAMQELYSEIEKFKEITDMVSITDIQRMIGNYYIEKEKQQIIDAYHINPKDSIYLNKGVEYYNSNFSDNAM
jgi:hypothetical protein